MNLNFVDEDDFVNFVLGGADQSKGGRDILNAINDRMLDSLAVFLFNNKQDLRDLEGSTICVSRDGDTLHFVFE